MSKTKIIAQNSENAVMQERIFLSNIRNQFIVNMICSFQDTDNLYLCLELMKGGDLRYHLINYTHTFTESQLKFLLTNLIMGIEYIHTQNIIHRDLKPENILFDNKGYAYLTDFNISCKKEEINKNNDINGTPVYMAPETIFLKNQDYTIDFYSLGIISYECIMGQRPYEGNTRQEIKQILSDFNLEINDVNISELCKNLIKGLLEKEPNNRLGSHYGISELKENIFFKGFNWDYLKRRKYVSPIIQIINYSKSKNRNLEELFDQDYCNKNVMITENTKNKYSQIMNNENYPNYFRKYTYLCEDKINEIFNKDLENGAGPPKKTFHYSKSTQNMNLPKIKTGNNNSLSMSNYDDKYHRKYIPNHKKYRYPSIGTNHDRTLNYYHHKLNKYRKLLRYKDYYDYPDDYHYPNLFNQKNSNLFPPGMNYMNGMNGSDIYTNICRNIENKLYNDIFSNLDNGLRRIYVRRRKRSSNQFQINNYFPPSCMMHAMCMPIPINNMMNNAYANQNPNPNPNSNVNYLPTIYTKHRKHHYRTKSDKYYSISYYTKHATKHHKSHKSSKKSEKSSKTTKRKKSSTKESSTKKSKKSTKKKSKKHESEDEEEEEEEEEDTKKKKEEKKR